MKTWRFFILIGVMLPLVISCGPQRPRKESLRGRTARGPVSYTANGQPAPYNPNNALWGEIHSGNNFQYASMSGDQQFQEELRALLAPSLGGSSGYQNASYGDYLGYVSGQSNQSTGVFFWGYAAVNNNGQLEGKSAQLHIEIYDDKVGQIGSNGKPITQIVVDPRRSGCYSGAQGYVQGYNARLTFNDCYGSIVLDGGFQDQYFSGTVHYKNNQTGGQWRQLGQFIVPTCGFFRC